ncbi:hypothetical protein [Pelagicoccus sp. SDUM812002]|uniref:tetratricopeptide repeat protein n=1 Tax=Pelagicoccus sp. SDUM812002 TaxID=3041266 RepID=UPI00280E119D|nr:hypothetical protein [Pelagicoccus sp. SDUM812002]MDQ8184076.1 hypothetical protein [Pelagicoccus sp. SDUM812002]
MSRFFVIGSIGEVLAVNERDISIGVARGYLRMERFGEAIDELEMLQSQFGICDDSFELMIFAFVQLGELEAQNEYSRRVLFETNFSHGGAWANLIYNYGTTGNLRVAHICINRALAECAGSADVNYEAARVYCLEGNLARAANFMMKAIGFDLDKRAWLSRDPDFESLRLFFKRGMK